MTKWIELREKIRKIYGKHNRLILAVVKFILALFLFLLINHYVGYMEKLHHVYIAVALALICAMLPVNMTVLLAAVFTVVHLYALSMEVAVTALLIFLLMFFLYFRFSPKNGYEVVSMDILPDDRQMLSERMKEIADSNAAELILTTGGTGFSPRDIMPEATEDIVDRRVPGIPEAMRAYSMTITKRAMLSRATAGIRKKTLIINLPGSPKAVKESLEYIIDALGHGIEIMTGEAGNCARK